MRRNSKIKWWETRPGHLGKQSLFSLLITHPHFGDGCTQYVYCTIKKCVKCTMWFCILNNVYRIVCLYEWCVHLNFSHFFVECESECIQFAVCFHEMHHNVRFFPSIPWSIMMRVLAFRLFTFIGLDECFPMNVVIIFVF